MATPKSSATTPADNGYDPQCGAYDGAYSGNLSDRGSDPDNYEQRDSACDASRTEFAKDKPMKYPE